MFRSSSSLSRLAWPVCLVGRFGDNDDPDRQQLSQPLPSLPAKCISMSDPRKKTVILWQKGDMNAMGMFVSSGALHSGQGWFWGRKLKMSNQKTNRKRLQTSSRIFVRRGARESSLYPQFKCLKQEKLKTGVSSPSFGKILSWCRWWWLVSFRGEQVREDYWVI